MYIPRIFKAFHSMEKKKKKRESKQQATVTNISLVNS